MMDVYVEIGKKKTFAGATDWPGWIRSGRDETSALQALCDYGPRYARVIEPARLAFQAPANPGQFRVTERLEGNATTDFGAPDIPSVGDAILFDGAALIRSNRLLEACWQAFDAGVLSAAGRELRKGPRGGGRDLDRILRHVLDGDASYLSSLGWKFKPTNGGNQEGLDRTRQAIRSALVSAVQGELPERGPRGAVLWNPRYFVRRVCWHVLDHTWELEDRIS